jgi:hypothetical protein
MRCICLVSIAMACSLSSAASAGSEPVLVKPGKVISAPDLKGPLGPEWSVSKGKWEPANGVLTATELPEEHHSAVLHLKTGPTSLVWECEFRLNTAKVFYVGCDANKHVGRLVVTQKAARLAEDSTEVKGQTPSHVLAESAIELKPAEWQKLRIEYSGDRMVAQLNDRELKAQHPYLATPKVRWWFAAGGGAAEIRNVRVSEGEPLK